MVFLSVAVSVVFLVYLLLRISRMLGGGRRVLLTEPAAAPSELPHRSDAEVNALLASMPMAWVTYRGMTPPLQLKIRCMSQELYRRFAIAELDPDGQDVFKGLPTSKIAEIAAFHLPDINAAALVVDWKGVMYPNGNPVPYSPSNMASFMRKDEMLLNFVADEAGKLAKAC